MSDKFSDLAHAVRTTVTVVARESASPMKGV